MRFLFFGLSIMGIIGAFSMDLTDEYATGALGFWIIIFFWTLILIIQKNKENKEKEEEKKIARELRDAQLEEIRQLKIERMKKDV